MAARPLRSELHRPEQTHRRSSGIAAVERLLASEIYRAGNVGVQFRMRTPHAILVVPRLRAYQYILMWNQSTDAGLSKISIRVSRVSKPFDPMGAPPRLQRSLHYTPW